MKPPGLDLTVGGGHWPLSGPMEMDLTWLALIRER
jgi:hypothetical protein